MHALISSLAFWLSATVVCSQVIRVDPSGRGDYREIRDAVAAARDGATIGVYLEFQIVGKALTILGAGPRATSIFLHARSPAVRVAGLSASQQVWVSGIGFGPMDVQLCHGSVVFERCLLRGLGVTRSRMVLCVDTRVELNPYSAPVVSGFRADQSTVRMESCSLLGGQHRNNTVVRARGSSIELLDCEVVGSAGLSAGGGTGAQGGGDAIAAHDSRLLLAGGSVRGGMGGAAPANNGPGQGGDAITATGNGALILRGSRVIAGRAGIPGRKHGRALVLDPSVVVDIQPSRLAPVAWLDGFGRRGAQVSIHATAAARSLAVLGLGDRIAFHSLAPLSVSRATVVPRWFSSPFAMALGSARVDLTIPVTAPLYGVLVGQFFVLEPDGTLGTSNSIAVRVDR